MLVELGIIFLLPAVMVFAGALDLFTMTISNRISIGLVAGFVLLAPFAGFGWETIALHFVTGAAMLVLGIAAFAAGWIGGGDAKLFAAASLWMGHEYLYEYALVTSIFGGVLTLGLLLARRMPLPAGLAGQTWIARLHDAGQGVPYGVAMALAVLVVYPQTRWLQGLI
ncbi:MAG TPA: peptidase [Rhizobiales bacterium]|nr:type IV leader peptidase family protein [bacterium BMS3Bbin10]HDO51471.1 peptidase [Hyphomicrobiales bacterium]